MAVFGICKFFGRYFGNYWRYLVFKLPNGDDKIQFLIENTKVTVYIQKFGYGMTVIVGKNLVRPPRNWQNFFCCFFHEFF